MVYLSAASLGVGVQEPPTHYVVAGFHSALGEPSTADGAPTWDNHTPPYLWFQNRRRFAADEQANYCTPRPSHHLHPALVASDEALRACTEEDLGVSAGESRGRHGRPCNEVLPHSKKNVRSVNSWGTSGLKVRGGAGVGVVPLHRGWGAPSPNHGWTNAPAGHGPRRSGARRPHRTARGRRWHCAAPP